ncbi:MAG TPA: FAD binding domain-containing protein [Steroidobacteraceae bacterium]|nr:FAD binding domain-containing protein [Steroidobacteraceae bacterium]
MQTFDYQRAAALPEAVKLGKQGEFLAGGTTLVDLMKLNVMTPARVVDINALRDRYAAISIDDTGLSLGAFASMAQAAVHPKVNAQFPVIAQSLQLAASQQIRNMATLGGNLLQRTRCTYFRDVTWTACNKRTPGSGCAALQGFNRNHAVLGVDNSCIAQYPGDFAVALLALDAELALAGPGGARRLPLAQLHRAASGQPQLEHNLKPGEIITAIHVPSGRWTARSIYIKVRDRESYEFAIASAAVALELDGDTVRGARIALGGLAYRPWRATAAEQSLAGKRLTADTAAQAATLALEGAVTHGYNDYKPELGRRTVTRALLAAAQLPGA